MSRTLVTRALLALAVLWGGALPATAQSWTITGVVTDAAGVPMPGVDLDLHPALGGPFVPLTGDLTAVDGSFTATIADTIAPGDYDLTIVPAPGHLEAIVPLALAGSVDIGTVALDAGWILTGSVSDASGQAVGGVDIAITPSGGGGGGGGAVPLSGNRTAPDGSFALTMPAITGFFDIDFSPPTGVPLAPQTVAGVFIATDTSIPPVTLPTAWFISGQVFDAAGAPLAGIDLNVRDATGTAIPLVQDDTDISGSYSVQIPEGTWDVEYRQVIPGPVQYVPVYRSAVAVYADTALPAVTLFEGAHLTGVLQDLAGTPQVDVDVDVLDPVTGELVHTPNDNSDGNGVFDVLVPAGTWSLEFRPPPGSAVAPLAQPGTVAPPPAPTDLGVIAMPTAVAITGVVVGPGGAAVANADLDLVESATGATVFTVSDNTDSAGSFSLLVPSGIYDVQVRPLFASGLAPVVVANVDASAGADTGTITLPVGFVLAGTITAGGAPVADAVVTLADSVTGIPVYAFGNRSDAFGQYALRAASGSYDVTVTPPAPSGLPSRVEPGVALSADVVLDVDLVTSFVRGNANLSGSVNLTDVILILDGVFTGIIPCADAADVNDDGAVDISDPVYLLLYLFGGGASPPAPFPAPGTDPTADALGCG